MALKITQFQKTVTTAGAAQPLSTTDLKKVSFIVSACSTNSGTIYMGDGAVDASTRLGAPLSPGDTFEINPSRYFGTDELADAELIFVDSTADGDKVTVSYFERED